MASTSSLQLGGYKLLGDPVRVLRAVSTNQLARFTPNFYMRITGQTGRGAAAEEGPADIAQYFRHCIDAYFEHLHIAPGDVASFLAGKTLMEYGPGDLPGVAALMVARGARKVYCVDRFPMVNLSPKNASVLRDLINGCNDEERNRLLACLVDPSNLAAGFSADRIEYLIRPSGLSGLQSVVDLVISRAVLEHVNDVDATVADMLAAMRPGAMAIHKVDLRSHGLHKVNPLDFLAWSPFLWKLMYSEKGVPNRWRIDRYRAVLERHPVEILELSSTQQASTAELAEVRPVLASPFRMINDEDLSWLGFWLVMRKLSA